MEDDTGGLKRRCGAGWSDDDGLTPASTLVTVLLCLFVVLLSSWAAV